MADGKRADRRTLSDLPSAPRSTLRVKSTRATFADVRQSRAVTACRPVPLVRLKLLNEAAERRLRTAIRWLSGGEHPARPGIFRRCGIEGALRSSSRAPAIEARNQRVLPQAAVANHWLLISMKIAAFPAIEYQPNRAVSSNS